MFWKISPTKYPSLLSISSKNLLDTDRLTVFVKRLSFYPPIVSTICSWMLLLLASMLDSNRIFKFLLITLNSIRRPNNFSLIFSGFLYKPHFMRVFLFFSGQQYVVKKPDLTRFFHIHELTAFKILLYHHFFLERL